MSYQIANVEVTQPLPILALNDRETGIAVILRRRDRPIGFVMQPLPAGGSLAPETLSAVIAETAKVQLLQAAIREELTKSTAASFPSLTVAICTKDRPDNLARCLNALLPLQQHSDQAHSNQGHSDQKPPRFEILVVDNAPSDDRTRDLVATFPTVRYTCDPKPGLDFARNRALQTATGDYLAFLDDDVVVDRGWFEGWLEAWAENPDAGAFTGLVLPYELETEAQILFEERGGFRRGFEKLRYGKSLPNNPLYPCGAGMFGAGCNMAFRRSVLLQLGGFDEALDTGKPLPGGGDLDIFYRVLRSGYPLVYEPRYLVFHQHRREYEKLRHQYWTWGLGFMAYVVKSYQTDPDQQPHFIQLIKWWVKHQLCLLKDSITGGHTLPVDLVLAESWGGIVGLFGEYSRSQRRIERIHEQFPS